jgi:S1-C subfamily serine protease
VHTQLLHLSGPLRGRTITYRQDNLLVGTDPDAAIRFPVGTPGVQPRHAEFAFLEEECAIHLHTIEGPVYVNGAEIKEIILSHQDLLEFGTGGPRARFRVHQKKGTTCKPMRAMLSDAQEVGKQSGPWAFSQSFVRDVFIHSTPRLRIGLLLALVAIVMGFAYLGGYLGHRRGRIQETKIYQEELAKFRKQMDAYAKQQAKALAQSEAEVKKLRTQIARTSPVLEEMLRANQALKRVFEDYTKSVCLLHGIWGMRKPEAGKMVPVMDDDGDPLEFEYVGSGFLASKKGHVVTNRHVAQPWWENPAFSRVSYLGFEPHFLHLSATFPGKRPVVVDRSTIRISKVEGLDVAIMQVDAKAVTGRPALPLYKGDLAAMRGKKVIVLGYPTGLNAVIAKADPKIVEAVRTSARDLTEIIDQLATHKAISPHITQGALNEVRDKQLVYDAQTTSGGSGGPVFGVGGEVIGVNSAILRDFTGSNFGVPIRFARELLPK